MNIFRSSYYYYYYNTFNGLINLLFDSQKQQSDFICIFEDCQAIDENNMVMIGAWFNIRDPNGNGVMISTDGGSSWKGHNWNLGASDAHYGSTLIEVFTILI